MKQLMVLATAFSALAGCAANLVSAPSSQLPVQVETFASPAPYSVNAYLLVGPTGLVVVDSLRTGAATEALVARIRALGRPLSGVLLTHTHPDHIGGLRALKAAFPGVPIYASADTIADIRQDRGGYIKQAAQFVPGFGPTVPVPDRLVRPGEPFNVGGISFIAGTFGAGESEHTTVYLAPGHDALFVSDLVGRGAHPWLVEGRSGEWLTRLDELEKRYAAAALFHPGHGSRGEPSSLIGEQRRYLADLRRLVAQRIDDAQLDPRERDDIVAAMDRQYPYPDVVAPLPELKQRNVEAIAKEMIAAASKGRN
jgi:glyoxylase-like metal-dependent hydrolase (beta-lactamase superfamily II)